MGAAEGVAVVEQIVVVVQIQAAGLDGPALAECLAQGKIESEFARVFCA